MEKLLKTFDGYSLVIDMEKSSAKLYKAIGTIGNMGGDCDKVAVTQEFASKFLNILKIPSPSIRTIPLIDMRTKLAKYKSAKTKPFFDAIDSTIANGARLGVEMNFIRNSHEFINMNDDADAKNKNVRFSKDEGTIDMTLTAYVDAGMIIAGEHILSIGDRGYWNYLKVYKKTKSGLKKIEHLYTIDFEQLKNNSGQSRANVTLYDKLMKVLLSNDHIAADLEFMKGIRLVQLACVKNQDKLNNLIENYSHKLGVAKHKRIMQKFAEITSGDPIKLAFTFQTGIKKAQANKDYAFWNYMK